MKKRYSYSLPSATRFIPIFDTLITQIKNHYPTIGVIIPADKVLNLDMKVHTFQQRLVDGLKFIAENYTTIKDQTALEYTEADYALLKAMLKLDIDGNHNIMIGVKNNTIFFTAINNLTETKDLAGNNVSSFKRQVSVFLEDGSQTVKTFTNYGILSTEDKQFIEVELKSLNIEHVWKDEGRSLTLVK